MTDAEADAAAIANRRQMQTIKQSLAAADVEFIKGQLDDAAVSYAKAVGLAKGFSAKEQADSRWKETFLIEAERRVQNVKALIPPERVESLEDRLRAKARAAEQEEMQVGMTPEEMAAARKERQEILLERCTMISAHLKRAREKRDGASLASCPSPPRARRPKSPVVDVERCTEEDAPPDIESAIHQAQEITSTHQHQPPQRRRVTRSETPPAISDFSSPEERYAHLGKPTIPPPAEKGVTAKELQMLQELESDAKKAQKPLNYYAAPWADELFMEADVSQVRPIKRSIQKLSHFRLF